MATYKFTVEQGLRKHFTKTHHFHPNNSKLAIAKVVTEIIAKLRANDIALDLNRKRYFVILCKLYSKTVYEHAFNPWWACADEELNIEISYF